MASMKDFSIVDNIIHGPDLDYVPDSRGVGHVLYSHIQKYEDRIFQIEGLTEETDTYRSFGQKCVRTALTMKVKGLKPNDIITICTEGHLDSTVPFLASIFLGVVPTTLEAGLALDEVVHLLKQTEPKIIFVDPEVVGLIESALKECEIRPEIVIFGNTDVYVPFATFLVPSKAEDDFRPFCPESVHDTVAIFFSSGTSALPKGNCISHFVFLGQVMNTIGFGYCLDVGLEFISLYWAIACVFWAAKIIKGARKVVYPKFPENVWEVVEKFKPTFIFMAPFCLNQLCYEGRPIHYDVSSVKDISIGGGYMSKEQIFNSQKLFPTARVCLTYGQTEVFGYITTFAPSQRDVEKFMREKPTSSGSVVPGFSYKVVDLGSGNVLGPNQTGEIRLKTDLQLSEYYKMDSSSAWDSDGWLKTGDIGYYDQDGYFYVVDRLKDVLKLCCFEIAPATIEKVLLTHPMIKAAVVIGKPHESDGDLPMAVVVLRQAGTLTEGDIEKYVEERVHDRKRLRGGVIIVDRIPTTPTGKLKRREVRKMYLELDSQ